MAKKKKKIKIPKRVMQLTWSKQKFAKKNDFKIGKKVKGKEKKRLNKQLTNEYSEFVIVKLNKAVHILSKVSNEDSKKAQNLRDAIVHIITNNDVMERIAKIYKKNPDEYPYLIYLPYMITSTLLYYTQDDLDEEQTNIGENIDSKALVEISEMILKKSIKKYQRQGLSKNISFQVAAMIPTAKRITNNRRWMRKLIQLLYGMAENEEDIDFEAIIKAISRLDKDPPYKYKELRHMFYSELILTRSSNKNHSFNDSQKDLNERLIESSMEYLNDMKTSSLRTMLKNYIKSRKTAEKYKTDGKRIIKFTDIANSSSEYERIKSVVTDLISDDPNNELYLS